MADDPDQLDTVMDDVTNQPDETLTQHQPFNDEKLIADDEGDPAADSESDKSSVVADQSTPVNERSPNSPASDKCESCLQCGVKGLRSTFVGPQKKYCSLACQRDGRPTAKANVKKKILRECEEKVKKESKLHSLLSKDLQRKPVPYDSTQISGSKAIKPEKLPPFKWDAYLEQDGSDAASVTCFRHVPMWECWENITVGIKVEVFNTDCHLTTDVYWIATFVKIFGYKVRLRYEGFGADSSHDFWMNLSSEDLHPVGWCASLSKPLVPPQAIQHKYVDWKEFLVKRLTGARTLPLNFHDKVQEAIDSTQLKPRMRVEVVDKMWVSAMRVAQVAEVHGGRCRLQYEASTYEDNDFWIHEKSPLVHYVGWSESTGHSIHASAEYRHKSLKKFQRNDYNDVDATPNHFDPLPPVPVGGEFQVGMKLEAVDPLNLSAICPATVTKVLDRGYIMIGIDGQMAANGSDWFALHMSSPMIFPAGFCDKHNIHLTPPKDYPGKFTWSDYLYKHKATAAADILFQKPIPKHGFCVGMKLEAVDLMEPRLICVASVSRVVGRLLRIHFDGWESTYDQWVDCESPDIYPVGWCEMIGYTLEGPPDEYSPDIPVVKKKKYPKSPSFGKRRKRRAHTKTTNQIPDVPVATPPLKKTIQSETGDTDLVMDNEEPGSLGL